MEKHLGRFFGAQECVELLGMKAGEETYIAPEKRRRRGGVESKRAEGHVPCNLFL